MPRMGDALTKEGAKADRWLQAHTHSILAGIRVGPCLRFTAPQSEPPQMRIYRSRDLPRLRSGSLNSTPQDDTWRVVPSSNAATIACKEEEFLFPFDAQAAATSARVPRTGIIQVCIQISAMIMFATQSHVATSTS